MVVPTVPVGGVAVALLPRPLLQVYEAALPLTVIVREPFWQTE